MQFNQLNTYYRLPPGPIYSSTLILNTYLSGMRRHTLVVRSSAQKSSNMWLPSVPPYMNIVLLCRTVVCDRRAVKLTRRKKIEKK